MRRLFQLLMPALAALVVGLFVLIFSFVAFDAFEVRGGLFVLGLYMLCTAAALAVVGALCLDTTYRPATAARAKKRGGMLDIARQPDRLARAYVQMYTIPFLPIALLTFGTGILVSTMLWGIVNEKLAAPVYIPEIIMAGWLVAW
jgi:hypothetical protein